jgi:Tol biopolymer transport system component
MTVELERGRHPGRERLQEGQCARIVKIEVDTGRVSEILVSDKLLEAPNWVNDGKSLIINSGGHLYRLWLDTLSMELIDTGDISTCNNDHVISPDGTKIYFSADGHLYMIPITGGIPRKLSNDIGAAGSYAYTYWLHGVSPDDKWLSYVAVEPKGDDPGGYRYCVLIPTDGGQDIPIMDRDSLADGPEYSPDGKWIYFNAEIGGKWPGHSQIFRMSAQDHQIRQLTFDTQTNWFPHVSPDGGRLVYLAYDKGTEGHPADLDVKIMLMASDGGEAREVHSFFGGQGSINVNSWSPDGRYVAVVEYPPK